MIRAVFTVEERDRLRDHMLALAKNDPRVVAGRRLAHWPSAVGDGELAASGVTSPSMTSLGVALLALVAMGSCDTGLLMGALENETLTGWLGLLTDLLGVSMVAAPLLLATAFSLLPERRVTPALEADGREGSPISIADSVLFSFLTYDPRAERGPPNTAVSV